MQILCSFIQLQHLNIRWIQVNVKIAHQSMINNVIPHTTGASSSIYKILPNLQGKVFGTSVRVPTSNVSLID